MGNRVGYILTFIGGALVGAIVAYKFAYDKAEEKADMEIEEMRQYFMNKGARKEKVEVAAEKSRQSQNKPSVVELASVKDKPNTQAVNYTAYSDDPVPEGVVTTSEPVILDDPNEFGDITHYSRVNLTYYDDLILADDSTMKTFKKGEIDMAIGPNALDRLGEIGPDGRPITEICVRNDRTKTYYNIVQDDREYAVAAGWEDDDPEY